MNYLNIFGGINLLQDIVNEQAAKRIANELVNGKKLIGDLVFKHIDLDKNYAKKWNEISTDFGHLYKGDKKLSDTLYRIGGLGINSNEKYFQLIKYTEAHYSKEIMKMSKSKNNRHLKNTFCILDINGIEKIEFKQFHHGYIHGCTYSLESNYYNIETNELYCRSHTSMETNNYLFLDNKYDDDKSKRGVMKINKHDGLYELIN